MAYSRSFAWFILLSLLFACYVYAAEEEEDDDDPYKTTDPKKREPSPCESLCIIFISYKLIALFPGKRTIAKVSVSAHQVILAL